MLNEGSYHLHPLKYLYGLTKEIKLLCAKDKDWAKMIMDDDIDSEGNTVKEQITIHDIISFMYWECDCDQIWE